MIFFLYISGDHSTVCQPLLTLQINKLTIFTKSKGQGEYNILVGKKYKHIRVINDATNNSLLTPHNYTWTHQLLNTVKPVLRGHLWDKQKVVFQDR